MSKLLILADEDFAPLVAMLAEAGHEVVQAYDSGHVVQQVMRQEFDAVIIPEDAGPTDGEELLPLIRRLTRSALVVAGEGTEETRIAAALLQGADAYLRYPDEPIRIRSRLRAILRRAPRPAREATEDRGRPRQAEGGESSGNGRRPGAERQFRHLVLLLA